jgi:hypothetical protein
MKHPRHQYHSQCDGGVHNGVTHATDHLRISRHDLTRPLFVKYLELAREVEEPGYFDLGDERTERRDVRLSVFIGQNRS